MAKRKRRTSDHEHYVKNADFTQAIVEYVSELKPYKDKTDKILAKSIAANRGATTKELEKIASIESQMPVISEYIGDCFLRMAEGYAHKPNFYNYSWREEMVMDGVENCVKAIANFKLSAETRSGNPNAFGYFTQIIHFAFLRRIAKEKRQQEIKENYRESANISQFIEDADQFDSNSMIERIRVRDSKNY